MAKNTSAKTETMPAQTKTVATETKTKRVRRARPAEEAAAKATTPAPVEATPTETPATDRPKPDHVAEVEALKARLVQAIADVKAQKARLQDMGRDLVTLVESLVKDTNQVLRKNLKRKRRTGSNTNSGFMKPKPVSAELCEFLSKPTGSLMSRTEVTRAICDYVKTNDLRKPDDKRVIVPDSRLATLLRMNKDETMNYIHLQSKIGHLFIKEESA